MSVAKTFTTPECMLDCLFVDTESGGGFTAKFTTQGIADRNLAALAASFGNQKSIRMRVGLTGNVVAQPGAVDTVADPSYYSYYGAKHLGQTDGRNGFVVGMKPLELPA